MKLFRVEMRHCRDGWSRAAKVAAIPRMHDTVVDNYGSTSYQRVYVVCHVQHIMYPETYEDIPLVAVLWVDDEIVAE